MSNDFLAYDYVELIMDKPGIDDADAAAELNVTPNAITAVKKDYITKILIGEMADQVRGVVLRGLLEKADLIPEKLGNLLESEDERTQLGAIKAFANVFGIMAGNVQAAGGGSPVKVNVFQGIVNPPSSVEIVQGSMPETLE